MEKQLRAYVHSSSSFTSHLGKTNDVQILNQLLACVQYLHERGLLDEHLFSENLYHKRRVFGLVWLMITNCEP